MAWYQKIKLAFLKQSSVTVFISDDGVRKISQPKTILDLCHDLSNFFYNDTSIETSAKPLMNDIAPDGMEAFEFEGTINVYPSKRILPPQNASDEMVRNFYQMTEEEKISRGGQVADNSLENMMPVIEEWMNDKSMEGYEFKTEVNKSNMTGNDVLRIHVLKNPSQHYSQLPEVNMSNLNFRAIMNVLGLNAEASGNISVNELLSLINRVSNQDIENNIRPDHATTSGDSPDDAANDLGMNVFTPGIDEKYIDSRLQDLYRLADFAKQNGFKEISWA